MATMKILIATPAYGGLVDVAYHSSVLATVQQFHAHHREIAFQLQTISISMIWQARNIFASMVLADPSITHLLFIDADMGFKPPDRADDRVRQAADRCCVSDAQS
jgi:hypothetical protein